MVVVEILHPTPLLLFVVTVAFICILRENKTLLITFFYLLYLQMSYLNIETRCYIRNIFLYIVLLRKYHSFRKFCKQKRNRYVIITTNYIIIHMLNNTQFTSKFKELFYLPLGKIHIFSIFLLLHPFLLYAKIVLHSPLHLYYLLM